MTAVARWVVLAALGLAIAAGIAFAASKVVSQPIGLSGQSFKAGDELAPPPRGHGGRLQGPAADDHNGGSTTTTPQTTTGGPYTTTTLPPVTTAPPATGTPTETSSAADGHQDD